MKSVLDYKIIYSELHYKCIRFGVGAQRESPRPPIPQLTNRRTGFIYNSLLKLSSESHSWYEKAAVPEKLSQCWYPRATCKSTKRVAVAPSGVQSVCGLQNPPLWKGEQDYHDIYFQSVRKLEFIFPPFSLTDAKFVFDWRRGSNWSPSSWARNYLALVRNVTQQLHGKVVEWSQWGHGWSEEHSLSGPSYKRATVDIMERTQSHSSTSHPIPSSVLVEVAFSNCSATKERLKVHCEQTWKVFLLDQRNGACDGR